MKTVNREDLLRIMGSSKSSGSSNQGGSGGGSDISRAWIETNYLSKEFFSRVFTILDANGDAIEPNDTETVIDKVSLPSDMAVTGDTSVGGNMSVTGTSQLNGHVGIGTAPHNTYTLNASGEVRVSTGVLSNGYVTALSDIRKKNVIDDIELDVNAIALARLIRFTWKDRKFDKNEHVGGIAQEWQKILPEAVHEAADGTLSMDYGAIGMISAVTAAREVVRLKKEVESLKKEIEELKRLVKP